MIRLILSDMDGTLLDDKGRLPAGFDDMIQQLHARGILFAPCSGRQYPSLLTLFAPYQEEFLFIAENGALAQYRGQEIVSCALERQLAADLLARFAADEQVCVLLGGKRAAYLRRRKIDMRLRAELARYGTRWELVDDWAAVDDEVLKLAFFVPEGRAKQRICPQLREFGARVQIAYADDRWVDVMAPGVNKGAAVKQVQHYLGLEAEECAAFGDYANDADMLKAVAYSFAVANAQPAIRSLARFAAPANTAGGVMQAVGRLIQQGLCDK